MEMMTTPIAINRQNLSYNKAPTPIQIKPQQPPTIISIETSSTNTVATESTTAAAFSNNSSTTTSTIISTATTTMVTSSNSTNSYVLHPGASDVLMGRGGATNNHEGNKMFRELVHDHQDEYLKAVKRDKKGIAKSIVAIVRGRGGGFLKRADDGREGWVEVGDKKAWEKTSQALREGLDAKSLLAKGIVKSQVLAEVESDEPPRKRRRRHSNADVVTDSDAAATAGDGDTGVARPAVLQASLSPALVSEAGPYALAGVPDFDLGFNAEDDLFGMPYTTFAAVPPPPVNAADIGETADI